MSLGYRRGHDHIAARRPVTATQAPLPMTQTDTQPSTLRSALACRLPVPRGLIPTAVYSLFALAIPLLWFFMESPDYTDNGVRGTIIGGSALAGLIVILANDCCCWYNMMLFFHIGIEAKVVDAALKYSELDTTDSTGQALAITTAIVIIVHLVPFLLTDRIMLLSFLAYVGVVVNVATVVYVDTSLILIVLSSTLALLSTTMIIGGICEIRTSMLSLIMDSINKKMCLTCEGFEL